eukprot:XP_001180066.2 PREDICTED: membrane-associated guanylate kinase, WW and PDZ domain-containing protein 1 isoform X2 [Strongylocentrotus purpuratus]
MALVSSITATMKDKKNSKPPKHWTQNIQECAVRRAADGGIHFAVGGGAENGQFPYVHDLRTDRIVLESGKLHVDDILLELNNYKLAGYTLWDLKSLINHLGAEALRFKTLKAGQNLPKDLRRYLTMRMPKGSPDHDLQQTIRENLYVRTVPCTTRPPREGEVNGVDYKFLSVDEFLALEKSGHLLESGLFEGNHYGTPKPPQDPPPETPVSTPAEPEPQPQQNNSSSNTTEPATTTRHIRPGSKPSAPGKRQRNKSTIEATTLNPKPVDSQQEKNLETVRKLEEDLGPLPTEWEIAFTETGDMYYIDHRDERTQWLDPRLEKKKKHTSPGPGPPSKEELPDGWEKIDDPQYGTYYIDHVNRKTQFNSPSKNGSDSTGSPRAAPIHSYNTLTRKQNTDSPGTPRRTTNDPDVTKQNRTNGSLGPDELANDMYKFTNDPNKLIGPRYTTHLFKGVQGFGFTIIGGDDPNEFLQIRNILPTGPAHEDGILQTGDVLVSVNKRLVLGCTHKDVVTIFQGIKPGERVELEVCRGYPLPFDPADPKAHIVTSYAIDPNKVSNQNGLGNKSKSLGNIRNQNQNIPPDYIPNNLGPTGDDAASRSSHNSSRDYPYTPPNQRRGHGPSARRDTNLSRMPHVKSLPDLSHKLQQQGGEPNTPQRSKTPTPSLSSHPGYVPGSPMISDRTSLSSSDAGPAEKHDIVFVKSNQGFGFTVADSPHGQKVKQILAPQRCKTLREGDLLLEINRESITDLPHNQVVQKLKDCPQGQDTIISVQRGGLLKPVRGLNKFNKNSPKVTLSPEEKKREEERFGDLNGSRQDDGEEDRASVDSDQKRKTDILVDEMKNKLKKKPPPDVHDIHDRKPVNGDNERLQNNLDMDNGSDKHSIHDRSHPDWEVENFNSNKDRHRGRDWHDPKRVPHRTADRPHSRAELDRRSGDRLHSENIPRPQSSRPDQGGRYMNGDWSGSLDRRRPPDPPKRGGVEPMHVEQERRGRPSESGYSRDPSRDPSREPSEADWSPDMRRQGPGDRQRRPPDDRRRQENERRSSSRPRHPSSGSERDDKFIESTVFLKTRDDAGFGFRIIGGHEEGSQVSIGAITAGGVAAQDGRLLTGDELLYVDGQTTVGSSHKRVVTLMIAAGRAGRVSLGIRRRVAGLNQPSGGGGGGGGSRPASRPLSPASPANSNRRYPYDVKLLRRENEGFGLVVLSSTLKSGSNIGRIIDGSPADRCRDLEVGDRIVSINGIDIRSMHHKDIVNMIKDTGTTVTLTIGSRGGDDPLSRNPPPKNVGHMVNALAMPAQIKGSDGSMRSPPGQPMTNHIQPPPPTDNKPSDPIYAKSSKWKTEPDRIRTQPTRPPSAPPQSMTYHDAPQRPISPPMGKPMRGIPRQQQQPPPPNNQDAGWGPQQHPKSPHAGRRSYEPQRTHPLSPPQDRRYRGPPSSNPVSPRMDRRGYREPGRPAPQQGKQLMYPPKRNELQPGDYYNVDLKKGTTGFGFSIRGGREYDNTPLFVLRMADGGPAAQSILMRVGDELIEINSQSTEGMLHSDAIIAIRNGGDTITLVLRRSYQSASMDPRHMTQTPPPMSRNASMGVSNSSLQSDEMHRDEGMGRGGGGGGGGGRGGRGGGRGRGRDNFDNSWNYRSLPRGLKY